MRERKEGGWREGEREERRGGEEEERRGGRGDDKDEIQKRREQGIRQRMKE